MSAPDPNPPSLRADPNASLRVALLGHRGAVLWLTGLSGSGKSTLAAALETRLLHAGVLAATIDGDVLRCGLSRDLGFEAADRRENIRRAGEMAGQLAQTGAVTIVALISPFRSERATVARRLADVPFAEVFINAPLAVCEHRDPKLLYKRARAGEIRTFTGIDSPYEPPLAPALELHTDLESVDTCVAQLEALALRLARTAGPSDGGK
jgi:adenylyl-sulfate kinase